MRFRNRIDLSITAGVIFVLGLASLSKATTAKAPPQEHPLAQAAALQRAHRWQEAEALLSAYLKSHPGDSVAWLMLAQTTYWRGDISRAEGLFQAALVRFPTYADLQVAYARFLMEVGRWSQARKQLQRMLEQEVYPAETRFLLGRLAFWQQDFPAASRYLQQALQLAPGHREAQSDWLALRQAMAPVLKGQAAYQWDNQPLKQPGIHLAGTFFLRPTWKLTLRVTNRTYPDHSGEKSTTELETRHRWQLPGTRAALHLQMGGVLYHSGSTLRPILGGGLEWPLPAGAQLKLKGDVRPYLFTIASLDSPVTRGSVALSYRLEGKSGRMGEVLARWQRFSDGTRIWTAYTWWLFPLVKNEALTLAIGPALSYADATASRFIPSVEPVPLPETASLNLPGTYAPYYTPEQVRESHLVVFLQRQVRRDLRAVFSTSAGLYSREQAPFLTQLLDVPSPHNWQRDFYTRSYFPLDVRLELVWALKNRNRLSVAFSHSRTAFYRIWRLQVQLTKRFLRAP